MKYITNPPDAAALMTSARSFGNYDLAGALGDLIDNSIKARASLVALTCLYNEGNPEVRIVDDGHGMSSDELKEAMRPASTNPLEERSPDDLGRFGWGMKSASFSQCRRLTVLSRRDGELSGAVWDLDDINQWQMGVLSEMEAAEFASEEFGDGDGTEIIWNNCDRLSEDGTLSSTGFDHLIANARSKLALTYHRFIAGKTTHRPKLTIRLNGTPVPEYDPYYRKHDATQELEPETLTVKGSKPIQIRPYILPHYSKLRRKEIESLSGDEGLARNQGFYLYRNDRLIIHGTWFRLIRHGELSQLVRISVDIPNSMDEMWKITVDKSDAQLPAALRHRLKQVVDGLRRRASKVHRSKGGKLQDGSKIPVWNRYACKGQIRYEINREHPLVAALLSVNGEESQNISRAVLSAIESGFPVISFGQDLSKDQDSILQTEASAEAFREFLNASVPHILAQANGDRKKLHDSLKVTEPFSSHWIAVADFLKEKGLLDE